LNSDGTHLVAMVLFSFSGFLSLCVTFFLGIQRMMRVNSTNVLNEGLRIGEIGHRKNSKVKSIKQGVFRK
jgi:hypothetical protein